MSLRAPANYFKSTLSVSARIKRPLNFHILGSLRSRRLEVVGTRKNGRARRRHARGEVAPARKVPENRFPPPLQLPPSPLACLPRARALSLFRPLLPSYILGGRSEEVRLFSQNDHKNAMDSMSVKKKGKEKNKRRDKQLTKPSAWICPRRW